MADADLLHPRVRAALEALGVDFEVMECDPALADTAAFVEAYGVPSTAARTRSWSPRRAPNRPTSRASPGDHVLDVNNVVRREMGVRKASFARAEPVIELTGMEIGGVTPFGLPDDLPVLVDHGSWSPTGSSSAAATGRRSCGWRLRRWARFHPSE